VAYVWEAFQRGHEADWSPSLWDKDKVEVDSFLRDEGKVEVDSSLWDEEASEEAGWVETSSWNQIGSIKLVEVKVSLTYLQDEVVNKVDQVSGRVLVWRQFVAMKRSL
jgi:hypothetical protein